MTKTHQELAKETFLQLEPLLLPKRSFPALSKSIRENENKQLVKLWKLVEKPIEAEYEIVESFQKDSNSDNKSDIRSILRTFFKEQAILAEKIEKLIEQLKEEEEESTKSSNKGDMIINNNGEIGKQINIKDNYGDISL